MCPEGIWVAIVSTLVETNDPVAELAPGFALLGTIAEKFISIQDLLVPVSSDVNDHVLVSCSYDATSHFETVVKDVKSLWKKAMKVLSGKEEELDLEKNKRKIN